MAVISTIFNSKQQVFIDFVLSHYIGVGVEEHEQIKLKLLTKPEIRFDPGCDQRPGQTG